MRVFRPLRAWLIGCALLAAGCAQSPGSRERAALAHERASAKGWQAHTLPSQPLALLAYLPARPAHNGPLVVYIEGDGLAWLGPTRPSSDPTPVDPLALRMALAQPGPLAAAYLARPCQFVRDPGCDMRHWTDGRFSEAVIASTNDALDLLKRKTGASRLMLVGYSGGAAVAALVAARRQDVDALVTVAGNLDLQGWVRHHRLSPLKQSLEPSLALRALGGVPQIHLLGGRDTTVPPALALRLVRALESSMPVQAQTEPGFDHACCWAEQWPRLWQQVQTLLPSRQRP